MPSGAATGNVVVTVNGLQSNGVRFVVGVNVPPSISAQVSPAPNASGWNNSNVTVTFTCTPGSAAITNCPSPQTITTEGANQVISGTATDANGLNATASVTLNIDKTQPLLSGISPADGTVVSSSPVAVSGTVSDALSGLSAATCNGTAATVNGGSFSCNISLNVGVNLVMVRLTDVAGNAAGSNFHVSLSGTLPAPTSLQVSPISVNMLVGDTQLFTAVDQLGRPRSDATWTISNTSLASITTDSSPTLTANAVGTLTLTATVGSKSAQAQVTILSGASLPAGTVRWSAPSTPGFTVQQIVQAVPTANGPDLYSIETDGNSTPLVRALTADGRELWVTLSASGSYNYSFSGLPNAAMPDGNGGLLINLLNPGSNPQTFEIVDLDAQTGAQIWVYNSFDPHPLTQQAAIRGDGTIFRLGSSQGQYTLLGLDPITGSTISTYIVPAGSVTFTNSAPRPMYNSVLSPPTVGPDGSVYSVVTKTDIVVSGGPAYTNYPPQGLVALTLTTSLLQIAPDGTSSLTQLRQDSPRSSTTDAGYYTEYDAGVYAFYQLVDIPGVTAFHVIPDGQGGSLVPYSFAWSSTISVPPWQQHITHVSSGTVQYDAALPLQPSPNAQEFPMALGDTGTAFATDQTSLVAFNSSSGQTLWTYAAPSGHTIDIIAASSGGGVVLNDSVSGLAPLDPNGVAGTPTGSSVPNAIPWALGNWIAAPNGLSTMFSFSGPSTDIALSPWPEPKGDPQTQNAPPKPVFSHFVVVDPGPNYTAQQLMTDMTGRGYLPPSKADQRFFLLQAGTVKAWLGEAKTRLDALAFIGHSIEDQTTGASLGILFTDKGLVKTGYNYQIPVVKINALSTKAKVLFFASCNVGTTFKSLWGIDTNTTGRALIVPSTFGSTNLLNGAIAWRTIATLLAQGNIVSAAVQGGNDAVAAVFGTDTWIVIGDQNVKIVP